MYYEINVSLNGKHFFATAERSCQSMNDLRPLLEVLQAKFPEKEGYDLSVTRWDTTGSTIDPRAVFRKGTR